MLCGVTIFLLCRVLYNKPQTSKAGNESVFTEVVGNVRTEDNRNYYALSTLDGEPMA